MERLKALLSGVENYHGKPWILGKVSEHYKRCTADEKERLRLAVLGQKEIFAAFGNPLYFSQAMIAGSILSDDYDNIIITTPSQFGKALADNTPVFARRDGHVQWLPHGELRVGDEVKGFYGEWVEVEAVGAPLFMDCEVEFTNDERIVCHENHEWYVTNGRGLDVFIETKNINCYFKVVDKLKAGDIYIRSVNKVPKVIGNCIQVKTGIYRVGQTMIPTHNSWILARTALVNAERGRGTYVAGASEDTTRIIMQKLIESLKDASEDLRGELLTQGLDRLARLGVSLSKKNIALKNGGFIEPITLGAAFGGLAYNKAVGRSADFMVDEAALVPSENFSELGRREFSKVDGRMDKLIMISNPHRPGYFYDKLTEENPPERTFILWMDALTAVQEQRWTKQQVLDSDFAKVADTRTRYLMCELPQVGQGMFGEIKAKAEPFGNRLHFLGVDAAYKGKDNIEVCHVSVGRGGLYIHEIATMMKKDWIDGVTSSDIIANILRLYLSTGSQNCCVDIGYGVWLVEGLAKSGVNVQGINFASKPTPERVKAKHYASVNAMNVRAEMHLDLQDLIDKRKIACSPDVYNQIHEEMAYVTCERKPSGKILIRPKADIKGIIGHSPDELDSVLLAIHAAILYTGETTEYMV